MKREFEALKEIVERIQDEAMPVKYVMLGRIMQAMTDDALTISEARKLEALLGIEDTDGYGTYREYGLMGPEPASTP